MVIDVVVWKEVVGLDMGGVRKFNEMLEEFLGSWWTDCRRQNGGLPHYLHSHSKAKQSCSCNR